MTTITITPHNPRVHQPHPIWIDNHFQQHEFVATHVLTLSRSDYYSGGKLYGSRITDILRAHNIIYGAYGGGDNVHIYLSSEEDVAFLRLAL